MKPISKNQVRNLLSKTKVFKGLKERFSFQINQFYKGYSPDAIEVLVSGGIKFKILTYHNDWKDDTREDFVYVSLRNRYRISNLPYEKNYYDTIMDNVYEHITEYLNRHTQDLRYDYINLAAISAESLDEYSIQFLDLIAWDYDKVGIWYVEQECGEGWIILPRDYSKLDHTEYKVIDHVDHHNDD